MSDSLQHWLWFLDDQLVHSLLSVQPDHASLTKRAASHPAVVAAMKHWLTNEREKAMSVLGPALSQSNADALLLAAQISFELGDLPAAAGHYARLAGAAPDHACAAFNLGLCHAQLGEWASAAESMQRAVILRPASGEGWFVLGVSLLHLERAAEAASAFGQCSLLKPGYVPALCGQAAALHLQEKYAEALELYEQLLGEAPERVELLANAASAAAAGGEWEQARDYAARLERLQPRSEVALPVLAHASLALGEYEEAARWCDRLTQANPAAFEHWFHLGVCHQHLGRYAAAAAAYETALQIDPSDEETLSGLAAAQYQAGDVEGSKATWERVLEQDGGCAVAWLRLGLLHAADGDTALAQKALESALALPLASVDMGDLLMELRKAVAILLHQDGECAQAAGLYRQVLESGPEDAEILFDLGSALAALGRRDEAQDCWKQAIALRADLAPVLLAQLGESSLEVGIS